MGHQIPVLGGTYASRSRVDLPNLATRYQYWGVHLLEDLGQICQIWPLDVSTGGASAGRSRLDLQNLATRCQPGGKHLLADLGQICQIQPLGVSTGGKHLLADLGQICQIKLLIVSTGWYICWQIQGRSAKFGHQISVLGGTSASRSRVDLSNLAASCQYWWVHLPADLGQICQIWPPDISTRGYICQQIQGRSAKFSHQVSVLGGYICWQIQGRSVKFDLPICSPTSILYVKLGKYDLSELKSFIFI